MRFCFQMKVFQLHMHHGMRTGVLICGNLLIKNEGYIDASTHVYMLPMPVVRKSDPKFMMDSMKRLSENTEIQFRNMVSKFSSCIYIPVLL